MADAPGVTLTIEGRTVTVPAGTSILEAAKLVTTVHGVPGLKAAMDVAGFLGGPPRGPLAPAPPEAVASAPG